LRPVLGEDEKLCEGAGHAQAHQLGISAQSENFLADPLAVLPVSGLCNGKSSARGFFDDAENVSVGVYFRDRLPDGRARAPLHPGASPPVLERTERSAPGVGGVVAPGWLPEPGRRSCR